MIPTTDRYPSAGFRLEALPRRVHIAGGSGTGKSTLAVRIAAIIEAPIHHLDYVARDFGANRIRDLDERLAIAEAIAQSETWVTDGVHVAWTEELCRRADVIVWLDHVRWPIALARVFRRSWRGAVMEVRTHRWRRLMRPRSYAAHVVELYRISREIRAFDSGTAIATGDGGSRGAIALQLQQYHSKVVHCRSRKEIEQFVAGLAGLRHRDG